MADLATLRELASADLPTAVATLRAEGVEREAITGYQGLTEVDAIDAPGGERVIARDGELLLVYVGRAALPEDLTHGELVAAVGSEGETLRSRGGKKAVLHVVADQGIAWSTTGDRVSFLEIFPATTFDAYRSEIYQEPGQVVR